MHKKSLKIKISMKLKESREKVNNMSNADSCSVKRGYSETDEFYPWILFDPGKSGVVIRVLKASGGHQEPPELRLYWLWIHGSPVTHAVCRSEAPLG